MLHVYLASEVNFYFNIALWLQMALKEKVKSEPSLG